jgi:arginyl-tRNA synthetase
LGDWGKQYGVLAIGFDLFGNEEELVKNPIGHLYDIYVKVSNIQKEEADQVKELKAEAAKLKEEGKDASAQEEKVTKIETEGIDEQARRYFKGMVDGEPKAIGIWKRFRVGFARCNLDTPNANRCRNFPLRSTSRLTPV